MLIPLLIAAVIGYLLGSLPFGYLVAKSKGVNIFEVGSKSPGATNVRRVLGNGPGNFVFALDAIKGAVAAGWVLLLFPVIHLISDSGHGMKETAVTSENGISSAAVVGLIAALIGHSYSCFTQFRGGKGVATTAGGLLVLMPCVIAVGVSVWFIIFYASRYVSLASILAALALPVAAYFFVEPLLLLGLTGVIAVFVIIRHRANIIRLCNGTENRFVKKPKTPDASRS